MQTKVIYVIDFWTDGYLMPFRIFKIVFPKAIIESLSATKTNQ